MSFLFFFFSYLHLTSLKKSLPVLWEATHQKLFCCKKDKLLQQCVDVWEFQFLFILSHPLIPFSTRLVFRWNPLLASKTLPFVLVVIGKRSGSHKLLFTGVLACDMARTGFMLPTLRWKAGNDKVKGGWGWRSCNTLSLSTSAGLLNDMFAVHPQALSVFLSRAMVTAVFF